MELPPKLTSGFSKDSQIYLEYAYDTKLLRNGTSGNIMVLWSKSFRYMCGILLIFVI